MNERDRIRAALTHWHHRCRQASEALASPRGVDQQAAARELYAALQRDVRADSGTLDPKRRTHTPLEDKLYTPVMKSVQHALHLAARSATGRLHDAADEAALQLADALSPPGPRPR